MNRRHTSDHSGSYSSSAAEAEAESNHNWKVDSGKFLIFCGELIRQPATSEGIDDRTMKTQFLGQGMIRRLLLCAATLLPLVAGQTMKAPDITKQPTLYVVPYAHLDTQWRWEFPQVISEYLLKTMRVNFDYLEKYPHYVFNWSGSNRYRLMKEYFPADYARMKNYVAAGRWFPAGSSVEEGDVNLPSAEFLIRQVLYGNTYFRKEFGKASAEYMLPDCFGFPASLPTILAHSGVKGFSTQKLSASWQPAPKVGGPASPEKTPEGIPFNVGVWVGPDGESVIAALNPGDYGGTVTTDLSKTPRSGSHEQDWPARIDLDGKLTGIYADYHYIGTGDIGGAPREPGVKILEATVSKSETALPEPGAKEDAAVAGPAVPVGDGPLHVLVSSADQMFKDIANRTSRMPKYQGDLELINHSAGSLTSQAYHKRWIIKNELLGDAAEKASIAASWMGGRPYPQERLNNAWTLVMGGHFHDTAAGTATPRSYEFAQNDDVIALNQFAEVLSDATASVASALNTQTKGVPVVVFNPLNIAREDLVEAAVSFGDHAPAAVRVYAPDGKETPAQFQDGKVVFLAKAPSIGYVVYDVQAANGPASAPSALKVSESSLENARYRVQIDKNGDVSSIFDRSLNKELLSAPIQLAISTDTPRQWPAWNMDFSDERAVPRTVVSGPVQVRVKENGPARVSVEVTRSAENSKFVQTISLAAGEAGNRLEISNSIDWRTLAGNVKAVFPLAAGNENATYNWDIGTIQRPNENARQFEVASHRWVDLTDASGQFGATILTDCKNGSDKPSDHIIRITLIRTPGLHAGWRDYSDQLNQDWGHHEIVLGVAGHAGDWRRGQTDWQGYRLNDRLVVFESSRHPGSLGKSFSLLRIDSPRVRVLALKKAETSDEVILRMVELDGKPAANVKATFAGPLAAAREVNGQEEPIGSAKLESGALVTSFRAYQPRTFALKLGKAPAELAAVQSSPVELAYDLVAGSNDDTHADTGFDGKGNALPAEMLPREIDYDGVRFQLAPAATGTPNALVAKGQTIDLPSGDFNRVYILAAAVDGDQTGTFRVGNRSAELNVEDWGGFVGQWDTRVWKNEPARDWAISATHAVWPPPAGWPEGWEPKYPADYAGLRPGFIKPATLGWYASHHHTAQGLNEPYQYAYLFAYSIPAPAGAKTLTLPQNDKIRILAVSVSKGDPDLKPAQPLLDVLPISSTQRTVIEHADSNSLSNDRATGAESGVRSARHSDAVLAIVPAGAEEFVLPRLCNRERNCRAEMRFAGARGMCPTGVRLALTSRMWAALSTYGLGVWLSSVTAIRWGDIGWCFRSATSFQIANRPSLSARYRAAGMR
jgi:alpha-mannosidase